MLVDLHSSGNKYSNSLVFIHLPVLQPNHTATIDLLIPLENILTRFLADLQEVTVWLFSLSF